ADGAGRHGAAAIAARRNLARVTVADGHMVSRCNARLRVMLHHRRRPSARSLMVPCTHEIARDEVEVQEQHPRCDGSQPANHNRILSAPRGEMKGNEGDGMTRRGRKPCGLRPSAAVQKAAKITELQSRARRVAMVRDAGMTRRL